ncbi:efflux RND transporter periplasmic adaptor subunit [Arcanobacterium pinnipediorum]|uniref:Efflux RND transporter periplasmic adaptor subunit n=1 Tax=Arcanobacterium pinnipediorum TaxID=1503041 RepID=A0ABY5AIP1_9ACTO|nr:efflux RND transporter periplasmic adaptor subunit [Arcanobacterium pinnipediorum]USR79798.1 efflux RND transporter periplasmic adaptor subunit [Arcanobacterium pinnipediorum]
MEAHPTRKLIFSILRLIIGAVIAVALTKFAFFPDQETSKPLVGQGQFVLPTVSAQRGDIKNDTQFEATVLRDESKAVKSTAEGEIVHFFVADGAQVEQGAPLLQVKTTVTEQIMAPAAKSEDSEDERDSEPSTVTSVSYNNVVAPIAGTVHFDAIIKQHVTYNDPVGTIVPASFHATVNVTPDQLYALQSIPQEAQLAIANGPAPFTCTNLRTTSVKSASQSGDGISQGSSPVLICDIPGDQTVFDGIKATLNIAGEQVTDALLLPVTAVEGRFREGKVYLPMQDITDEPTAVVVKLGINDGKRVVITEGLDEQTEVLEFVPRKSQESDDSEVPPYPMGY